MNTINFSKENLKVCHKKNCVTVKGKIEKAIILGVVILIALNGINSILEIKDK